MKKLVILILICGGCSESYYHDPGYWMGYHHQPYYQQRPQTEIIVTPRKSWYEKDSTEWQERAAHQQYWDAQYRKLGIPPR